MRVSLSTNLIQQMGCRVSFLFTEEQRMRRRILCGFNPFNLVGGLSEFISLLLQVTTEARCEQAMLKSIPAQQHKEMRCKHIRNKNNYNEQQANFQRTTQCLI